MTPRLLRTIVATTLVLAATAAPAPALAGFGWSAPESRAAADGGAEAMFLGSGGLGLVTGFSGGASDRYRIAVRPRRGPLGEPAELPGNLGLQIDDPPRVWFAPSGDSLITNGSLIAFRPAGAGAAVQEPRSYQHLSGSVVPMSIAFAPNGDALVAMQRGSRVLVAYRPAGADSDIDMANLQDFGEGAGPAASIRNVTAALDPTGGAVVVWNDGSTLWQAVRPTGEPSFDAPAEIAQPSGLADNLKGRLRVATAASGDAVVSWLADVAGDEDGNQRAVVAAARRPGGAFGPARIIHTVTDPEGSEPGLQAYDAFPAVTDTGDGLVAIDREVFDPEEGGPSCGNPTDAGAFAVFLHDGDFGSAAPIGSGAFPLESTVTGANAAGGTVAVQVTEIDDGDTRCNQSEPGDRDELRLLHYVSSPGGLTAVGSRTLAATETVGSLNYDPRPLGVAVSAEGGLLAAHADFSSGVERQWLQAFEESSDGGPGPVDPGPGAGGPGPGGGTPPPVVAPPIPPIVPRTLIRPAPISGGNPTVVIACPPEIGSECATWIRVYTELGVVPGAAAKKKAKLLGSVRGRVAPGKTKRLALKLTKAGRKAARARRRTKVRILVTTTAGTQTARYVAKTTLKPKKRKKKG